jgi:predicted nucleotidyltransferase
MLTQLMPAARVKVLAFLLLNAPGSFHLREIARRSGAPLKSVQREVAMLEDIELVRREQRGNQVLVSVNTGHPLYDDLRSLFVKSEGLAIPLRDALARVEGLEAAAVYGSVAAGTDTGSSDIDLLIVGDPDDVPLHDILSALEEELGRTISCTVLSRGELRSRMRGKDPFLGRVLSGTLIKVMGDVRED